MAECRFCGHSGFLVRTDKNGLCRRCSAVAEIELTQVVAELDAAQEHLHYSRSTRKRLADCERMLELLALVRDKYELKGIFILKPVTAEWVAEIHSWREPIIIEGVTVTAESAFEKAFASTTVKVASRHLQHAAQAVADAQAQLEVPNESLTTLGAKAEKLLSAILQSTDEQVARQAARMGAERHSAQTAQTRQRLLSVGIDLVVVIGGAEPCEDCRALIAGGPYSLSGADPAHVPFDAAVKAHSHFGAADCHCCIVADATALDAMAAE